MLEQNISSKEQVFVNETHYILKYYSSIAIIVD